MKKANQLLNIKLRQNPDYIYTRGESVLLFSASDCKSFVNENKVNDFKWNSLIEKSSFWMFCWLFTFCKSTDCICWYLEPFWISSSLKYPKLSFTFAIAELLCGAQYLLFKRHVYKPSNQNWRHLYACVKIHNLLTSETKLVFIVEYG